MSSTTTPTTFSDLYTDLMNRIRADTGGTATIVQAKRYINIALQDMHIGFDEKVPWAERRAVLVTQAPYSTGTLSVSKGGTALTGSSTAWNTNNAFSVANMRAGGKIKINGTSPIYEISSVASDTSATLASSYVGSDVSGGTYVYFEDEYALASDFKRPVSVSNFDDNASVSLVGRTEFRRRFPNNDISGRPRVATIIDLPFSGNTTPVRKIKFSSYPDSAYAIPYSYITSNLVVTSAGAASAALSSDSDEPIVYLRYRFAIVLHALYNWYRDKKDDTRSQDVKTEYVDFMSRMAVDQEIGAPRPRIQPRRSGYARAAQSPWRSGVSRRYDLNGKFDRME
jgi:hypothetical protein